MAKTKPFPPAAYTRLLSEIRREVSVGLRAVEQQKIKTYWNVGGVIHRFLTIQENPHGAVTRFYRQLAQDTEINSRTLQYCEQFFRYFPDLKPDPALSWSHYRYLLAFPQKKERDKWVRQICLNGWTSNDIRFMIKKGPQAAPGTEAQLTEPTRGTLYTYCLVSRETGAADQTPWMVDIGFSNRIDTPPCAAALHNKYLYTSVKEKTGYQLRVTKSTRDQLWTFKARVIRVIDADTLLARVDQGFGVWTEQRLRLAGIDAPEMSTLAGRKAKHWVETRLSGLDVVIVRTKKSDKYDRYLAEVFYQPGQKDPDVVAARGTWLNRELLTQGLAQIWK